MLRVWLPQPHTVAHHLLILHVNAVARNSDDALDVSLANVFGIVEGHDVAALHFAIGQQVRPPGAGIGVDHAIHQHVVAHPQSALHGSGGDHVGLHQRGGGEEKDNERHGPFGHYATGLIPPSHRPDGAYYMEGFAAALLDRHCAHGDHPFLEHRGHPIGRTLQCETKPIPAARRAGELAAAVAEHLLHFAAELQAELARVRVQHYQINPAKPTH